MALKMISLSVSMKVYEQDGVQNFCPNCNFYVNLLQITTYYTNRSGLNTYDNYHN